MLQNLQRQTLTMCKSKAILIKVYITLQSLYYIMLFILQFVSKFTDF